MTKFSNTGRDIMDGRHEFPSPAAALNGEIPLISIVLKGISQGATIVDYGCYGWSVARLAAELGRTDLVHVGIDLHDEPSGRPAGARFRKLPHAGAALGIKDADLVVASHVLEHAQDAVAVFGTLLSAVRRDGHVYVESPSERTALGPSNADVEGHAFTSFWDDPTHVRPWPPAALYRLGLSYGARPEVCRYSVSGGIDCAVALFRRVEPDPPRYRYVTLANVGRGVEAALSHVRRRPT